MRYTDLIFDLYGTLVDIHTEEDFATWEKTAIYFGFYGAHYSAEELQSSFSRAMVNRQVHSGQSYECYPDIPCEEVFSQLFHEKGITKNADELGFHAAQLFRISSIAYIKLYDGVLEALALLRRQGYRLWLLSNAQRTFTAYELRYLNLDTVFDGIYISSDYGCRKPDSRLFTSLIEEQNLDISKCLMIGNDRETDIAGAQKVGMDTLYMHTNITPPGQIEADLSRLPGFAPPNCRHMEFDGSNWNTLSKLIAHL